MAAQSQSFLNLVWTDILKWSTRAPKDIQLIAKIGMPQSASRIAEGKGADGLGGNITHFGKSSLANSDSLNAFLCRKYCLHEIANGIMFADLSQNILFIIKRKIKSQLLCVGIFGLCQGLCN